jgi:hypothetical protein
MNTILSSAIGELEPCLPHGVLAAGHRAPLHRRDGQDAGHFRGGGKIQAVAGAPEVAPKAGPRSGAGRDRVNCRGLIRELSDYLDGDLDRAALDRHSKLHLANAARTAAWWSTPRERPSTSSAKPSPSRCRKTSATASTKPSFNASAAGPSPRTRKSQIQMLRVRKFLMLCRAVAAMVFRGAEL